MNILDAFYQTVHAYPGGPEALAPRLGMSAAVLRNKANPNSAHNKPLLEDADRIMGMTTDHRVLHALAHAHGYVCVKVEEGAGASDLAVLELVARVWSAHGAVGTEVHQALEDGRITSVEIKKVHAAVREAERALEDVLARLSGMAEPAR